MDEYMAMLMKYRLWEPVTKDKYEYHWFDVMETIIKIDSDVIDYDKMLAYPIEDFITWFGCIGLAKITRPTYLNDGEEVEYPRDGRLITYGAFKMMGCLMSKEAQYYFNLGMKFAPMLSYIRENKVIYDWLPEEIKEYYTSFYEELKK